MHSIDDIVADLGPVVAPLGRARARRVVEAVLGPVPDLVPEDTGAAATAPPEDVGAPWLTSRTA